MEFILGSQSPRRKEILNYFDLPFIQVSSNYDEDAIPFDGNPKHYVTTLSKGKANALAPRFPESIIITADTIVYREGKVYGKPRSEDEGFCWLAELSGQWHSVFTALTIVKGSVMRSQIEETKVLFNHATHEQIRLYQQKLHWGDKAGGYAIQSTGCLIVQKIEGCYYNVMGLPINTLKDLLESFGIDLWRYLK